MPELDRRDFLRLVGVSAGGAAAAGCSDHVEKLIPYVVQPEEITPGIPVVYASTCQECSAGCGLHVTTREGRPIKLEGNPDHPVNRGALCPRGQSGLGRTYHPDRFRGPLRRGADGSFSAISWQEATALLAEKLRSAPGGARILTGRVGPTLAALMDRWSDAVGAGDRLVYEVFGYEALREASRAVFGVPTRPIFDLRDADFVIDFGADSLEGWLSPVEHQRQIKDARSVATQEGPASRLVYVGPRLTMTAGNADEWLAVKPGTEGILALALAKVAFETRRSAGQEVGGHPGLIADVVRSFDVETSATRTGVSADAIRRIGAALAAAKRPAALPPGVAATSRNAVATASAVLLLDAVVGAVGKTVSLPPADVAPEEPASFDDVEELIAGMRSGSVGVLMIHDANPVYSLPPGAGFDAALEKVDFVVSFASLPDETTERADLILPDHATLESWGDAQPRPGVRSLIQPTLRPLYDTQAVGDTLLAVGRALDAEVAAKLPEGSFRSLLEQAWAGTDWRAAVARGGEFEAAGPWGGSVAASVARIDVREPRLEGDGAYVLIANPSPMLQDGRGANLPWLQETPDPVTKIAWQSWLEMSNATAESLGIDEGDVVAVTTPSGTAELPIFPRGGIRDDVVALAIGQGHSVGLYASAANDGRPGEVRGVNVNALLPSLTDEKGGRAWLTSRVSVEVTGTHQRLPNAQHSDNKRGRALGESVPLAVLGNEAGHTDHTGDPGEGHDGPHQILKPYDATDDSADSSEYRWGMNIDLDRCSGCSACIVACAIENNVPTVGEEAIRRNRGMQWIRIERYVGDGEQVLLTGRQRPRDREKLGDVDVRNSPMMCQQCGSAPCEPVCPVFATYHDDEGLNAMVYNRCIGTRYCSNNCSYKVRRYNWFDYAIGNWPDPMPLMLNPDVTVRGQGVMEKCTFCVQRIQAARQTAKDEGRPIADGEVTPACAQTCPSNAIVFGNLKDAGSRVAKLPGEQEKRAYHALHDLNTRPAITYLAKVDRSEPAGAGDAGHDSHGDGHDEQETHG